MADDPRIEALAIALDDEDGGSVGWNNLREPYKNELRYRAGRLIEAIDKADPIRNYIRDTSAIDWNWHPAQGAAAAMEVDDER